MIRVKSYCLIPHTLPSFAPSPQDCYCRCLLLTYSSCSSLFQPAGSSIPSHRDSLSHLISSASPVLGRHILNVHCTANGCCCPSLERMFLLHPTLLTLRAALSSLSSIWLWPSTVCLHNNYFFKALMACFCGWLKPASWQIEGRASLSYSMLVQVLSTSIYWVDAGRNAVHTWHECALRMC